jgi:hypothetical protein
MALAARTKIPVLADNKHKCLLLAKGKQINQTAGKTARRLFYEERQNSGSRLDCSTDGRRIGFGRM